MKVRPHFFYAPQRTHPAGEVEIAFIDSGTQTLITACFRHRHPDTLLLLSGSYERRLHTEGNSLAQFLLLLSQTGRIELFLVQENNETLRRSFHETV
jgi:hypothetical protein